MSSRHSLILQMQSLLPQEIQIPRRSLRKVCCVYTSSQSFTSLAVAHPLQIQTGLSPSVGGNSPSSHSIYHLLRVMPMPSKLRRKKKSPRKPIWTFEENHSFFFVLRILSLVEHGLHLDVFRGGRSMRSHCAEQSLVVSTSPRIESHSRYPSSEVNS